MDKKEITGCELCGGKLVMIRGKYPGTEDREVCPTCLAETLDAIKARIDDNHNRPQTNK